MAMISIRPGGEVGSFFLLTDLPRAPRHAHACDGVKASGHKTPPSSSTRGRAQRRRRHGLPRRSLSHARSKPGYPRNGRYATAASAANTSSASITTTPAATAGDATVWPRDACCLVQQEAPLGGGCLITAAVSDPARAHRHARAPVQAERSRARGLRVEGRAARGGALQ